jgi:hypothetical protein
MNSSAKQTSPNQPRLAKSRPRAADFFLFRQAIPDVLETVPDLPPPGRNMPSTAAIRQGGKLAPDTTEARFRPRQKSNCRTGVNGGFGGIFLLSEAVESRR